LANWRDHLDALREEVIMVDGTQGADEDAGRLRGGSGRCTAAPTAITA
jgi:hypothetical protein